jgi:hypothetical protein
VTETPATRSLSEPGVTCAVYEAPDRRQWVTGYGSERAYGMWSPPTDEPVVVER